MAAQLYDQHGEGVRIAGRARRAGGASVYRAADRSAAVKVYDDDRLTPELQARLECMVARQPADPTREASGHRSIQWADGLVYADPHARRLVGCTIPAVDEKVMRRACDYYDPVARVARLGGSFTWRHLLLAAGNLAAAIEAVHRQGHRVAALDESHVLVAPSGLITLVGCDEFQIGDADGRVSAPAGTSAREYLPPEIIDAYDDGRDREHADLFALAVLVFRFLMLGIHPFLGRSSAARDAASLPSRIADGLYPYDASDRRLVPPEFAPDYGLLPPKVRTLFFRAFVDGHRDPALRPTAGEWSSTLVQEVRTARRCQMNPNHWHAERARVCPWCVEARMRGADPFPRARPEQAQASVHDPSGISMVERREHVRVHVRMALRDSRLSAEDEDTVHQLAAEIGLAASEVKRIISTETRRGPGATRRVGAPSDARALSRMRDNAAGAVRKVGELTRSERWRAGAPFVAAGAGAGIIAPVVAPALVILLVTPLLVTYGQWLMQPSAATPSELARRLLPRMGVNVAHAAFHAMQVVVPFWLIAALPFTALALALSTAAAFQAVGGFAVVTWIAYLLVYALSTDRFVRGSRQGWNAVLWVTLDEQGSVSWVGYVLWALSGLATAASLLGAVLWWPFGAGPFG